MGTCKMRAPGVQSHLNKTNCNGQFQFRTSSITQSLCQSIGYLLEQSAIRICLLVWHPFSQSANFALSEGDTVVGMKAMQLQWIMKSAVFLEIQNLFLGPVNAWTCRHRYETIDCRCSCEQGELRMFKLLTRWATALVWNLSYISA